MKTPKTNFQCRKLINYRGMSVTKDLKKMAITKIKLTNMCRQLMSK